MTRPTSLAYELPTLNARLGSEWPTAPSLSSNTVDRAAGIDVFIPPTAAAATLVQEAETNSANGGAADVAMTNPPTQNNLLLMAVAVRGPGAVALSAPDDWTAHPDGTTFTATDGGVSISTFYRTAGASETTTVATVGSGVGGGSGWIAHVSEWSGVGTLDAYDTAQGTDSAMTAGTVSPTAGLEALLYGAIAIQKGDGVTVVVAPDADVTELWDVTLQGSNRKPHGFAGYRIVPTTSGSYSIGGTATTGGNPLDDDNAGHLLVFTRSANLLSAGPNATDGDASTYITVAGTHVLDIDLGDRYRIVRLALRIATAAGGSRTYTISGANEADFSDVVELDSFTFTALGSFAAQNVAASWSTAESFRYFRLTGNDETRRIYSFELYEGTLADLHEHDEYIPADTFEGLGDLLVGTGSGTYERLGSVSSNVYVPTTQQDGSLAYGPFVRTLTANGSNTLLRPDVNIAAGTNVTLAVSSNTVTINAAASGGAALSYGSNANQVASLSAAGAATEVSRADHVHKGVTAIAHASNTYSGTVTLTTPGDTVGITSPTPGTLAFTATGGSAESPDAGSAASRHDPGVPTGDLLRSYTFDSTVESWTASAGTITASSGKARLVHTSNTVALEPVGAADVADGEAEAVFTIVAGVEASLVFRATDASNYYVFVVTNNGTSAVIYKVVAGTFTGLRSATSNVFNTGLTVVLMCRFIGSLIECYLNGRHMVSLVDATYTTGRVGARTFNATVDIDRVRVYDNPVLGGDNV